MDQIEETFITLNQVLTIANTGLIALVGFMLREAWKTIHRRMDVIEEQHGHMRERVSSLEAFQQWTGPRRRKTDQRENE